MTAPSRPSVERRKSIGAKVTYSISAQKKLVNFRVRIDGVQAKIQNAITIGRIEPDEQLACARRAVEINFETAQDQIEVLMNSGEETWRANADDVESAWEDLSNSIKKLVARFSDRST